MGETHQSVAQDVTPINGLVGVKEEDAMQAHAATLKKVGRETGYVHCMHVAQRGNCGVRDTPEESRPVSRIVKAPCRPLLRPMWMQSQASAVLGDRY